jgi:hypothetical protein
MGDAARVDDICHVGSPGAAPDLTGGSITLSTVASDHVMGSVALDFAGNHSFDATFDATVCTTALDLCELLSGCWSPVCAPTTI